MLFADNDKVQSCEYKALGTSSVEQNRELIDVFITGAAVDYTEGFVGCMRALQVNGEMLDLMGKVERGEVTYGVSSGLFSFCPLFWFTAK